MPKISVIIPVYNTDKYIEKCLKSITEQEMNDIEIIVVNDGSNDNSEAVISEFIKNNETSIEIKYFKKENGGLSDARNYGVKKASGKYIVFVDSDDYLEKDLYKNLEKYMDKDIDLIKFKMKKVNEKNEVIERINGPVFEEKSGEEAFELLCTSDTYLEVACIYLYKREFFIENKFEYSKGTYHEDFGLTPLIMVQAKNVSSSDCDGYCYFQRENSITSKENTEKEVKKAYDVLKHYDNAVDIIDEMKINDKTKMLVKRYYTNTVLVKAGMLTDENLVKYIKEINKRKMYKNIKVRNLKQLIKRIILTIDIKLYLKMK